VNGGRAAAVEPNDWLNLGSGDLHDRIVVARGSLTSPPGSGVATGRPRPSRGLDAWMTVMTDSDDRVIGRAALPAADSPTLTAVITVGGLRVRSVDGLFGVLMGEDPSLARNSASVQATPPDFARWASDQAVVYAEAEPQPEKHAYFAASVISYGGDPGPLKVCRVDTGTWVDRAALAAHLADKPSVEVVPRGLGMELPTEGPEEPDEPPLGDTVVSFVNTPTAFAPGWTGCGSAGRLGMFLCEVAQEAWGGGEVRAVGSQHGYRNPEHRFVYRPQP
jgi:hypothetical protein